MMCYRCLDSGRRNRSRGTTGEVVGARWRDIGFDGAEELSAKATLAVKLNELIEGRGLSQTEVAVITGITVAA
jgi:predicted XRE-type DNA-binding protein